MAQPFDENGPSRGSTVGDHDMIDGALLGAGASERIFRDILFLCECRFRAR
jgi:hypothetical protein